MIVKIVNFAHEFYNPNGKTNKETRKGSHA